MTHLTTSTSEAQTPDARSQLSRAETLSIPLIRSNALDNAPADFMLRPRQDPSVVDIAKACSDWAMGYPDSASLTYARGPGLGGMPYALRMAISKYVQEHFADQHWIGAGKDVSAFANSHTGVVIKVSGGISEQGLRLMENGQLSKEEFEALKFLSCRHQEGYLSIAGTQDPAEVASVLRKKGTDYPAAFEQLYRICGSVTLRLLLSRAVEDGADMFYKSPEQSRQRQNQRIQLDIPTLFGHTSQLFAQGLLQFDLVLQRLITQTRPLPAASKLYELAKLTEQCGMLLDFAEERNFIFGRPVYDGVLWGDNFNEPITEHCCKKTTYEPLPKLYYVDLIDATDTTEGRRLALQSQIEVMADGKLSWGQFKKIAALIEER